MGERTIREEREGENLKGTGKLLEPSTGRPLAKVQYIVTRYDQSAETFAAEERVGSDSTIEVYVVKANLHSFAGTRLTLEMEDGRQVTGVFNRGSDGRLALVLKGDFDE